jgi:hypothetical protein
MCTCIWTCAHVCMHGTKGVMHKFRSYGPSFIHTDARMNIMYTKAYVWYYIYIWLVAVQCRCACIPRLQLFHSAMVADQAYMHVCICLYNTHVFKWLKINVYTCMQAMCVALTDTMCTNLLKSTIRSLHCVWMYVVCMYVCMYMYI